MMAQSGKCIMKMRRSRAMAALAPEKAHIKQDHRRAAGRALKRGD